MANKKTTKPTSKAASTKMTPTQKLKLELIETQALLADKERMVIELERENVNTQKVMWIVDVIQCYVNKYWLKADGSWKKMRWYAVWEWSHLFGIAFDVFKELLCTFKEDAKDCPNPEREARLNAYCDENV
jgi:hypothetical protein